MKKYKFNEIEYELVEEYKDGFELEEAQNKIFAIKWTIFFKIFF